MTLTWTWEKPFENVEIFQDGKLIGTIIDFKSKTINQIFQHKISVEDQGLFGQHIYFNF